MRARVRVQTVLDKAVRLFSLAVFAVHFTLTLAFVSPLNPVHMAVQSLLNATIGTFFPQNWNFFAPNPVSSNDSLLVRCLTREENEAVPETGLPVESWHDISSPVWSVFQQSRFSAYDRLTRPHMNAIRQYVAGGVELNPWLQSCLGGSQEACKTYGSRLERARIEAGRLLRRIGSAYCQGQSGHEIVTHVALRVRQVPVAPWSKRYGNEQDVTDFDLGVYPLDPLVRAMPTFIREGSP